MSSAAETKTTWSLIRRFFPYISSVRTPALASAVLVLLAPLCYAALLWSFKLLVDDVLNAGNFDRLATFATVYVVAVALKIAIEFASQYIESGVVEKITLDLRSDLYRHMLSVSPGSHKLSPGDQLARLQGDTNRTEYLIYTGPLAVLADGAAAIAFIGFLFILSWQLAICALIVLPAIVFTVHRLAEPIRTSSKLSRRAESQWMTLAEERLDATSVVQAFSALDRESKAFRVRAGKVRLMEWTSRVLQARQSAIVEIIVALAGLCVLALGARLITSGTLTAGSLIAFIGAVGSLYAPIRSLAKSSGRFQNAAAGAQRVAAILDTKSLVAERPNARALEFVRGNIEFKDVGFTYPNTGEQILHGLSLSVPAGGTLAIVGPSGSGKSSLIRLLLRQYDCDSGAILLDGHDIRDLKLSSLRNAIAPVFQDALVLNGTIEKNIRYGAPGASAEAVNRAAQDAAVLTFASEKDGMLTPVGPGGTRLSGGQRQRIALARALLTKAPILVLDEATAGVDSETEEFIQDALDTLSGKHTIIVVAHRLSTVRRAATVAVVENGRVVEIGSPETLLAGRSRCREIFEAQLIRREAAE